MAKLPGDDMTVASLWGTEKDFAQRSAAATPNSLLRDIVADASRGLGPRSLMTPTPAPTQRGPSAPPAVVPTFREWAFSRLGVDWPEARAKAYYETRRTAGEDVGPVVPQSAVGSVPRGGWVDPPKLSPPPGIDILDRLLDHADRLDRAERAKNGGRW
jgi:hypothetical protein